MNDLYIDPPQWGARHSIALALALLDLDVVHRSTLRALFPAGSTKPRPAATLAQRAARGVTGTNRNRMSGIFANALQRLEEEGLIARGTEFVLTRNRRALLDLALAAELPEGRVLAVTEAIRQVNADLREAERMSPKAIECRRQELLRLKRLMEEGFGSANWSGRGSVRLIPRSHPL